MYMLYAVSWQTFWISARDFALRRRRHHLARHRYPANEVMISGAFDDVSNSVSASCLVEHNRIRRVMGIESVWQKFDMLSDFIFSRSDYM